MAVKKTIFAVIGLVALGTSCVDAEAIVEDGGSSSTRTQAVSVVPRFVFVGADQVPDDLYFTELGLVVSEIRLTPIVTTKYGLAYASAQPTVLRFNVAAGEYSRDGDTLELPERGRYVVSIRLEPVSDLTGSDESSSLSVSGFVAQATDITNPGKVADGSPLPLPFDARRTSDEVTDSSATPMLWTPFQYSSQRAVFYTLNDVELERGEQVLQFTFDLHDWAAEVAEPISKALRNNPNTQASDGVDVTRQVESTGIGLESLIQTGVVSRDVLPPR